MLRAPVEAVLWDLDGTITNSMPLIYAVYQHLDRTLMHREVSQDEIRVRFGPPDEVVIKTTFPPELATEAWAEFQRHYSLWHNRYATVFEGVQEVLEAVQRAGLAQVLVTAKGQWASHFSLQHEGLLDYFDFVVTGTDVKHYKPHPESLLVALARLRVEASRAVYIGDSRGDILAARAAGITPVLTTWEEGGLLPRFAELEPEYVVHTPAELHALLLKAE